MAELKPCGTVGAYQRHVRRKEPIDDACRDAMRVYQRERRTGTTEERPLQPCGTNAAYNRHLQHYEEPCEACRKAHRDHNKRDPKTVARNRARARAISTLTSRHEDEFLALLDAEMKKEGLR